MISNINIDTNITSLLEVLGQTGNPEVAIKILDGTYKEPVFDKSDRASTPDKDGKMQQYIFISYDKWKDEVHYKPANSWQKEMKRESWEKLELWESLTWDGDETDKINY